MRSRDNILFASGDLSSALRNSLDTRVGPAVDRVPKNQLATVPLDDLVAYLLENLQAHPLVLHEDRMETSEGEVKVDVSGSPERLLRDHRGPFYVPGYQITIEIPFTGEESLWRLKPSSWRSVFPHGEIVSSARDTPGCLKLQFTSPVDSLDEERLGKDIERELELVRFYVGSSSNEVNGHNVEVERKLRSSIEARKERVEKTEGLVSRLGLPLKRNPGAPSVEPLQLSRKHQKPLPKAIPVAEPEPGISDDDYDHILRVVRHELATFEATPKTYEQLGEEDLRNILLAHLNGHYLGSATGETFRKHGKTDIRIEDGNRAAFVAECKLWRGASELSDAIDQLLAYLTWRDCKTSLIVFNKSVRNFSGILEKLPSALLAHNLFVREHTEFRTPNEWRLCYKGTDGDDREVTVHVFIANLFLGD